MRNDKSSAEPAPDIVALNGGSSGAIDQVRELLFGEAKRTTEARLDDIDRQIELLRDDLAARFASLEASLIELGRTTDKKHHQSIDQIGQAINDLGATIRALGAGGKAR